MIRETILRDIETERERQDRLWGPDFDRLNAPNDWATFILLHVSLGVSYKEPHTDERFREHLIKAAALCVAAVEVIDGP